MRTEDIATHFCGFSELVMSTTIQHQWKHCVVAALFSIRRSISLRERCDELWWNSNFLKVLSTKSKNVNCLQGMVRMESTSSERKGGGGSLQTDYCSSQSDGGNFLSKFRFHVEIVSLSCCFKQSSPLMLVPWGACSFVQLARWEAEDLACFKFIIIQYVKANYLPFFRKVETLSTWFFAHITLSLIH